MLAPGGTVTAPIDTLSAFPAGTVMADTGMKSFVGLTGIPTAPPAFVGSYESWVVKDASTGTLDFVYKVSNSPSSNDLMHRLTMTDFTGFKTDVYTLTSSSVSPIFVDRGTPDAVGFYYYNLNGPGGIPKGGTVEVVIKTDAKSFTQGSLSIIDGGTANVAAYAPTGSPNPTPVPGAAVLLSTGLLSLAGRQLLRRGKNAMA